MTMIVTLSLLQFLADNGLGELEKDLFWEKLGVEEEGLYITDLGEAQERGMRRSTVYQIYSRGRTDLAGYQKLQQVAELLAEAYEVCQLPAVPEYNAKMVPNVTIMPPSTIVNSGEDVNGRVIYSITGKIYY